MSASMMMPLPEEEDPRAQRDDSASRWIEEMVRAEMEALDGHQQAVARASAVPRWFNQQLMVALMEESLSMPEAAEMIEQMRGWAFVRSLGSGRYAYRDAARAALLGPYAESRGLEVFHARAHGYFDRLLAEQNAGKLDESAWLRLRPELFNALREKVYHLLRLAPEDGFALLRALFRGAHNAYLPGEAEALLNTTHGMDLERMTQPARDELAFFEAVQDTADYRYQAAEARLNMLLEARSLEPALRARVLGELGKLLSITGRLNEAVNVFRQAQAAWEQLGGTRESAAIANNLGSVYLGLRDYRAARAAFGQALDVLRQFGSQGDQAQAYNNLGTAYEREEEWNRALEYYQTSLTMKESIGDSFGAARTRANIGSVFHAQIRDVDDERRAAKLRDSAQGLYEQSLATFQQFGARSEAARVQFKLALLQFQSGQLAQARAALPEVLEEYRALRIPGVENVENLVERLGEG